MKTQFLPVFLFLTVASVEGQSQTTNNFQPTISKANFLFKQTHDAYFLMDASYLNLPIKNIATHGFSVDLNGVFNDHFATGFSMEVTNNRQLSMPTTVLVINPSYQYLFLGWNNEYLFSPAKIVNASVQLKTGLGQVYLFDKAETTTYFNGHTCIHYPKQITQDAFFVLEPGANVFLNLTACTSIGIGGHYRFTYGVGNAGTNADFTNYALTVTLRFNLDNPDCSCNKKDNK